MGLSRGTKAVYFAYKEPPFYERFGYPGQEPAANVRWWLFGLE